MHRLTVLLGIFVLPAEAADFRAIDIGQSCSTVDAWEMAHASTRNITHSDSGLEVYSYSVEQFPDVRIAFHGMTAPNGSAGDSMRQVTTGRERVPRVALLRVKLGPNPDQMISNLGSNFQILEKKLE